MSADENEVVKRIRSQMGERKYEIFQLRLKNGLTFKQIGEKFGFSVARARELYKSAHRIAFRGPETLDGLSTRAVGCLSNVGVESKEEAIKALGDGRLKPGNKPRGYGWKTHQEISVWCGLPKPEKPKPMQRVPVCCPNCGCILGEKYTRFTT